MLNIVSNLLDMIWACLLVAFSGNNILISVFIISAFLAYMLIRAKRHPVFVFLIVATLYLIFLSKIPPMISNKHSEVIFASLIAFGGAMAYPSWLAIERIFYYFNRFIIVQPSTIDLYEYRRKILALKEGTMNTFVAFQIINAGSDVVYIRDVVLPNIVEKWTIEETNDINKIFAGCRSIVSMTFPHKMEGKNAELWTVALRKEHRDGIQLLIYVAGREKPYKTLFENDKNCIAFTRDNLPILDTLTINNIAKDTYVSPNP